MRERVREPRRKGEGYDMTVAVRERIDRRRKMVGGIEGERKKEREIESEIK